MLGAWLVAGSTIAGPPFELQWEAPPACPSGAEVSATIDRYLASSSVPADAEPIRAVGRIKEDGAGFVLTLRIVGGPGERTLGSERCEDLAEATAFLVSLTVDPTLTLDKPEPPKDEAPKAEPPPEPEPSAPPKPKQPPKPRQMLVIGIDGGAGLGALPRIGGNVGATLAGQFGRGRVELIGRYAFPQRATVPGRPTAGARLQLGTVTARGCGVLHAGRVEFPLCGGIELGAVRAAGFGVDQARVAHRLWAGFNVGPSLAVVFGPAAFRVGVEATTLFARPRFEIAGGGTVHRLGPVHGRAVVGFELRWPSAIRPTKTARTGK